MYKKRLVRLEAKTQKLAEGSWRKINRPDTRGQILHDYTHLKYLEQARYSETRSRLDFTRG